jgi:signal recognition particle subunit SRP54
MLETLTRGFRAGRDRLRGVTALSEENVAEALLDVRASLLEADVDLGVARAFLEQVKQRCVGTEVALRSGKKGQRVEVAPGDHFTKACYEELVQLMGAPAPLESSRKLRSILLVGLQGTGKTSTAAKLAKHLQDQGERPLLVAADVYRPAAREQLRVLGERIGVEVFSLDTSDAVEIVAQGLAHAKELKSHSVIVDTAGRLQIDDELMHELAAITERIHPQHTLLVCDAMSGREAVNVARGFKERLRIDGLILTKLDGDSRGGAALAVRHVTGVPIRYVTVGEGVDRLETFRPEGLASRILGMGDVMSLMESFGKVADEEQAEKEAKRLLKGSFTLDDFLNQLRTIQKMGPLRDVLEKLPMAGELIPEGANIDGSELKRIEAMILSMTPAERRDPELIDPSREARIARGSGSQVEQLREMLERFKAMRTMMAQLGKGLGMGGMGGMLGRIPGAGKLLGRMGGGGMPDMSQLDPATLQQALGMGAAPNRAAARAMKAEAKRKDRKQKRKHQKRRRR